MPTQQADKVSHLPAVSAGHQICWHLVIGGIDTVFAEADLSLSPIPCGRSSVDPSLSVDGSGPIGIDHTDRDTGRPVCPSFQFDILDSEVSRAAFRRYTTAISLTSDVYPGDAILQTTNTAALPSTGVVYIGREAIGYTGQTTYTLTGITRGLYGTNEEIHHYNDLVCDRPQILDGADVALIPILVDRSGTTVANAGQTAPLSGQEHIWSGRITSMTRVPGAWRISADDISAVLDSEIEGEWNGTAEAGEAFIQIQGADDNIGVYLQAFDNTNALLWYYVLNVHPFEDLYAGAIVSLPDAIQRISAAWDIAVTNAGAGSELGSLLWVGPTKPGPINTGKGYPKLFYSAYAAIVNDTAICNVTQSVFDQGGNLAQSIKQPKATSFGSGMSATGTQFVALSLGFDAVAPKGLLIVRIPPEDWSTTTIPTNGAVTLEKGGETWSGTYADVLPTSTQDVIILSNLQAYGFKKPEVDLSQWDGAKAIIRAEHEGPCGQLMASTIASSGVGTRGPADDWAEGQGYGLRFGLPDFPELNQALRVHSGNFWERFGGSLASRQMGYHPSTGLYSVSVADIAQAPLVRVAGPSDPIQVEDQAPQPNRIIIQGLEGDAPIQLNDRMRQRAGILEVEWVIPAVDREAMIEQAEAAGASKFLAAPYSQCLRIRVPAFSEPAYPAVGESVRVSLSHPSVYNAATGKHYYDDEPGRVLGDTLHPATLERQLLVLVGGDRVRLLPGVVRVDATDSSSAPTYIDFDSPYTNTPLAKMGTGYRFIVYTPGSAEGGSRWVEGSAYDPDTQRLTVSAHSTSPALAAGDLLIPCTGDGAGDGANTWQQTYMYVDDGTRWQ